MMSLKIHRVKSLNLYTKGPCLEKQLTTHTHVISFR